MNDIFCSSYLHTSVILSDLDTFSFRHIFHFVCWLVFFELGYNIPADIKQTPEKSLWFSQLMKECVIFDYHRYISMALQNYESRWLDQEIQLEVP